MRTLDFERSTCCLAHIRVGPKEELKDPEGKTFYWVCYKCNKACQIKPWEEGEVREVEESFV